MASPIRDRPQSEKIMKRPAKPAAAAGEGLLCATAMPSLWPIEMPSWVSSIQSLVSSAHSRKATSAL